MVACAYSHSSSSVRRINNSYPRICTGTIYLYNLLTSFMGKENKISVPKKKKRIPLPGKPPKIEKDIKVYDRKKEKDKIRKKRMNH